MRKFIATFAAITAVSTANAEGIITLPSAQDHAAAVHALESESCATSTDQENYGGHVSTSTTDHALKYYRVEKNHSSGLFLTYHPEDGYGFDSAVRSAKADKVVTVVDFQTDELQAGIYGSVALLKFEQRGIGFLSQSQTHTKPLIVADSTFLVALADDYEIDVAYGIPRNPRQPASFAIIADSESQALNLVALQADGSMVQAYLCNY